MKIDRPNPFSINQAIGKVPGFNYLRQEGDSFYLPKSGEKVYLSLSRQKIKLILTVLALSFFLIFSRAFYLQVIQGEEYNLIAEGNRIRLNNIPAERGLIYDRFGNSLVANLPHFSLTFVPADLNQSHIDKANLALKLSNIINKNKDDILNLFNSSDPASYQNIMIADNLSHEEAISISVIEDDLPGINLIIKPRRQYLEDQSLSHILGYIGKINQDELSTHPEGDYQINDFIGKDGIELYYEELLRGVDGREEIEVDATGKTKKILNKIDPTIGSSLVLTIDLDLQKKLSEELSKAIRSSPTSKGGVAIALDPNSGEVLAMVSLPGFDNNFFSAGIQADAYSNYLNDPAEPLFDRAISGTYPPGSTFKPVVALAALEEGIIDEAKTFLSTGGLQINQWFFPDWKYGGHGRINVTTAIAESVNTFFYYIGGGYSDFLGLGVDKIVDYAEKFGLSKKLGIDLPGEAPGFLPSQDWKVEAKGEHWYIGDTYHLAIGQGDILVTPLQVALYTSSIANNGMLYQPHLLKEVKNPVHENSFSQPNYLIRENFINPNNIDIVRRGLRATVTRGSAQSLNYLSIPVAGKTGTAQVGGDKESHAWFTGFAPYDSPSIVLTILIENGGEGSSVAVPVFREVIDWYFSEN